MKNLNFINTYCKVLLALIAILPGRQLYAQGSMGRRVFLVPEAGKFDTCKTMEEAGRKWFDINQKTTPDEAIQNEYKHAEKSKDGQSVVIIVGHSQKNGAGEGGADHPEIVQNPPTTESTDIVIAFVKDKQKENSTEPDNYQAERILERDHKKVHDEYEYSAQGSAMGTTKDNKLVPILRYNNSNQRGNQYVKFDGIEGKTFIDRKLGVKMSDKAQDQIKRVAEALRQNPDFKVRYEVPPGKVKDMNDLLKRAGQSNNPNISVKAEKFIPIPKD